MLSAMFSGKGFKVEQDEDGTQGHNWPDARTCPLVCQSVMCTQGAGRPRPSCGGTECQTCFVSCFVSFPPWASHAWAHSSLWHRSKAWSPSWRGTNVHSPISTTIRASCIGSAPIGGQPRTRTRSTPAWSRLSAHRTGATSSSARRQATATTADLAGAPPSNCLLLSGPTATASPSQPPTPAAAPQTGRSRLPWTARPGPRSALMWRTKR
jgi:hypothetical protein